MLPVVPTIDVVVFPHMVVPLLILDEKIIQGIKEQSTKERQILLLAARAQQSSDGMIQEPIGINDLYEIGTIANVMRFVDLPGGGVKILIQGVVRACVDEILSDNNTLKAHVHQIPYDLEAADDSPALIREILSLVDKLISTGKLFSQDFQVILSQMQDPERIADFILSHLELSVDQAQGLLEQDSLYEFLDAIRSILEAELRMTTVEEHIKSEVRDSMHKSQREFYLREQMKAIQRELGEDADSELSEIKRKVALLPPESEARSEAIKQLKRLERTTMESMEATVIRNHLEWLVSMPWGNYTNDCSSFEHAIQVLNEHHFGLEEIKDRILDYLSVRVLKQDCDVPILCFVGPPGTGKTSLGKSIAECLGRNYCRVSLGGVYDESEIRGHRRTYVGALPGRFIQGIRKAESMNPLVVIDEIDKLGMANRGDPSAALLEVLDPEQNCSFYDNYLGIHFDLSACLFIATANDISLIPAPLRDRMEIIPFSGYTIDEKCAIAKNYLIPKAIKNSGLEGKGIRIKEEVVERVIAHYTRESGVRDLDRCLRRLCAKYARSLVEHRKAINFDKENLRTYLGPKKIHDEAFLLTNRVGVANGLAWTPFGGAILQVETVLMPGSGKLILTGQLGDVMRESARAALTYAKSQAELFGIKKEFFSKYDLHIHLPAGAIQKDGPSAGITLLSSVLSALTNRAIDGSYAMTGELNLQGFVLPIGGLKEKILAAKQSGLKNIIVPRRNQHDLEDIQQVTKGLEIVFVDNVIEVLQHVLLPEILKIV